MNKKVSHTNLWLDPLVYLRETCPTWETPIPKAETKKNEKTRELDSNSSKDMMCLVTLQSVHQKIKVIQQESDVFEAGISKQKANNLPRVEYHIRQKRKANPVVGDESGLKGKLVKLNKESDSIIEEEMQFL